MYFSKKREKGIMSLAVVFVIGFLGLGMVLTISTIALLGINKNRNTTFGSQAFYTAEAAVREGAYQRIKNNFEDNANFSVPINSIPESDISFAVYASPRGFAYREIEGNATNNLANRKINNTLLLSESWASFDYAIYSEYDLSITGSTDITGDVFSNGIITCGGSSHIDGNAFSGGDDSGDTCEDNANSTEENVDIISPPIIDPYYYGDPIYGGIADCISTLANVESDCLTAPATGVVFVDDPGNNQELNSVDLTGNLTIIGGDIKLAGGTVITASNDYAALVVDGNLKIVGGATITGLVYVSGNTTFGAGNTQIFGSLISKMGVTDLGGNVTIEYNLPSAPPGGLDPSGDPIIVSWQEQ